MRTVVFKDGTGGHLRNGYSAWTDEQLKVVRAWLAEFVVCYRRASQGDSVMPSKMKTYIANLQRAFKSGWGYSLQFFRGLIFAYEKEGLFAVMDNKLREHYFQGVYMRSHDVLTAEDVSFLYRSSSLSRETPKTFLTRLIFNVALITAMRPSSLWQLRMSQFERRRVNGEIAWVITGTMGSRDGVSKTERSVSKAVNDKPVQICV